MDINIFEEFINSAPPIANSAAAQLSIIVNNDDLDSIQAATDEAVAKIVEGLSHNKIEPGDEWEVVGSDIISTLESALMLMEIKSKTKGNLLLALLVYMTAIIQQAASNISKKYRGDERSAINVLLIDGGEILVEYLTPINEEVK